MLLSLAGLALADPRVARRRREQRPGTCRPPSPARRRCRRRTSSTSRARTNTRPTASASSASSPRASIRTAWRCSWSGCSASTPLRRRQRAVVPAHAPDHVRADRRSPVARAGPAVQAGARTRSTSIWSARSCKSYQGDAREQVAVVRRRAEGEEVQQRDRRALRPRRRRCCARSTMPRAKAELAQLEKIAPPHPMIEAMAGNVLMARRTSTTLRSSASRRRSRAIRTRCSSSTTIRRR